MLNNHHNLLVSLTTNMKEMETELRAHSIVLEALTEGVIEPSQMGEALLWARNSSSMLEFMRKKYIPLEELCASNPAASSAASPAFQFVKRSSYSH